MIIIKIPTPTNYQSVQDLLYLLKGKKDLVIAELGILFGDSTELMLKTLDIKKFYAIDLWEMYDGYDERFSIPKYLSNGSEYCYNRFVNRIKDYPQVEIIREYTSIAHKHVKDGELDFCFIDANHEYDYTYEDIKNWFPKIKKGGILAGDDYWKQSVKDAVRDYFKDTDYKVKDDWRGWWIVK